MPCDRSGPVPCPCLTAPLCPLSLSLSLSLVRVACQCPYPYPLSLPLPFPSNCAKIPKIHGLPRLLTIGMWRLCITLHSTLCSMFWQRIDMGRLRPDNTRQFQRCCVVQSADSSRAIFLQHLVPSAVERCAPTDNLTPVQP